MGKKYIEIETEIEEDVFFVRTDSELLALVWNNLFSNVIKFNKTQGLLALTSKTDGEYAVVTVLDTGCGISSEVGKHIFDKFFQNDTSHATHGNGLVLALVKRIADITGIDISVKSEVGKGSTFTVIIQRSVDEDVQEDSE